MPTTAAQVKQDQTVSPSLAISGDLVQLCGIKPAATANPKFDYDKDELTSDDRNVLDQLAQCLMTGPLAGRSVKLVGRADPRGETEYNMTLGAKRARNVHNFMGTLGVGNEKMHDTSRGEMDATGTDEAGWRRDRRVDVKLRQ